MTVADISTGSNWILYVIFAVIFMISIVLVDVAAILVLANTVCKK